MFYCRFYETGRTLFDEGTPVNSFCAVSVWIWLFSWSPPGGISFWLGVRHGFQVDWRHSPLPRFWMSVSSQRKRPTVWVSRGFSLQLLLHIHWLPETERIFIQFSDPISQMKKLGPCMVKQPAWGSVSQEQSWIKARSLTHLQLPLNTDLCCSLAKGWPPYHLSFSFLRWFWSYKIWNCKSKTYCSN